MTFSISEGSEPPAGFALDGDGTYHFDPSVAAYEHLGAGVTEVLVTQVTITDDLGATGSSEIRITVTGTNDAPVAEVEMARAVDEDAAVLTGQLRSSDLDDDAVAIFSISGGEEAPAGFELNANGSYRFDPTDSAYQQLKAGATKVVTIPVTVTDQQGANDTTEIQITITGTNDAPTADIESLHVDESTTLVSGQLTYQDDADATVSFSLGEESEPAAGFALNSDGSYQFDPTDSAYQHLKAGATKQLTIPVTITDEYGASGSTEIRITLTGTNDAPTADLEAARVVEEGAGSITGQLTASDQDDDAIVQFSIDEGVTVPPGFELEANGAYRFDSGNDTYQHLSVGESEVITIRSPSRMTRGQPIPQRYRSPSPAPTMHRPSM